VKANPLDYLQDVLDSAKSCQAIEIVASFEKSESQGWVYTWDSRLYHDDDHLSYEEDASHRNMSRFMKNLEDAINLYLCDLSKSFFINTPKKVDVNLYRKNPAQDIWSHEVAIEIEGWIKATCRRIKDLFS